MWKIVIVDDQPLMRTGLRGLVALPPDMEVVGEAGDGRAAVTTIRATCPDLVLLDIRMPGGDGVWVLRQLAPVPPTILLTTFDDDAALIAGIRAGARGFLLKDVSLERLLDAIRRVLAGETLIRPHDGGQLADGVRRLSLGFAHDGHAEPLTRRETEVLRMMAAGLANREIGDALGTSEGTIKNHASAIFQKLGVRDRTRAVVLALRKGLV